RLCILCSIFYEFVAIFIEIFVRARQRGRKVRHGFRILFDELLRSDKPRDIKARLKFYEWIRQGFPFSSFQQAGDEWLHHYRSIDLTADQRIGHVWKRHFNKLNIVNRNTIFLQIILRRNSVDVVESIYRDSLTDEVFWIVDLAI